MTRASFLKDINNESNHRLLLWEALKATKGNVVEFGSGHGSTKYLKKYCEDTKRTFESYDNNKEWANKTGSTLIEDWSSIDVKGGIILIDHAPGERRYIDIERLKDKFDIIVIHDSEPVGAGNYMFGKIWHLFKYRVDVKCDGAWATAVSNKIDLESFKGKKTKDYIIS